MPAAMPANRTWTILDLLNEAAGYLEGRGMESPRVNAEVLLGHVLGLRRVELYARFDREVEPDRLDAFRELVRRRVGGVPLQYLTGSVEFCSRTFAVREGVFIPRPETEVLVERALERVRGAGPEGVPPAPRVAEIGVGSGAVLVTLLLALPEATGVGTDVSEAALGLARENAERHGVVDRVTLVPGNAAAPLAPLEAGAPFALLVANPPYLADAEIAALPREVREHEPRGALAAGPEGLEALRAIVAGAWRLLAPRGALALEISETQGVAVLDLVASHGRYEEPALSRDYAGRDRVVTARRKVE